jgi:hypothetical protein
MEGSAMFVENREIDPVVIRAEACRPDHAIHGQESPILNPRFARLDTRKTWRQFNT